MVVDPRPATPRERRALGIAALLAALTFLRIALPLGTGLFLGALVAFTLYPLYRALLRWTSRPALAAFLCAALAWVVVAGGIGGLVYLLVDRGAALSQQMPAALAVGGPIDRSADQASAKLAEYGIQSPTIDHHLHHALEEVGGYAAGLAGKGAATAFGIVVAMFFMVITTYVVLRHWARFAHWAEALLPLRPQHTRKLVRELRSLGREAMLGTLLLGLLQGALAAAGYAVAGAPQAGFFGAMTAVASTLPALGTFLVWAPMGAYLIGSGHVVAGVLELLWGFFVVVTLCDGFIRPKVVGRKSKMGMLPTLIGLFGGLELFGFIGLLLGPTLVGLSLAILRLYGWERAAERREQQRAARDQAVATRG
jgi:predicted PurR-regulated permease PerM